MDETQRAKITRFLDDKVMSEAVYGVLLQSFLKPQPLSDVNILAASRIAINLLEEAWRDLEKSRKNEADPGRPLKQLGM